MMIAVTARETDRSTCLKMLPLRKNQQNMQNLIFPYKILINERYYQSV